MLLTLAGCASSPAERAWQMMHLVDVAQTINGPSRDPCFREDAYITRTLIGAKPDPETVIAWGVALSTLHYLADRWLTERGHASKPGVKILRALDLSYKGFTIGNNHRLGVRPFGANECPFGT